MKNSINDLFLTFLQDMYYAERQILKALPKMAKAAQNEELKQGLMQHREETQHQVERLQQVFEQIGKRARGQTCEALNGIVEEGEEVIEEFEAGPVRDAGILANAQAVEHYEMARYGTMIAWAKACGMNDAATLLEETLAEEKRADQLLTQIAGKAVNKGALRAA
ncbi:MAG TPA: ferritin-like domain-containing protein [Acetobacteraceae bacterium]|nr:ferritin-like domain-containing protein [Acetobacteraceae bacterium]